MANERQPSSNGQHSDPSVPASRPSKVPQEDATIEEIEEAVARTGRAAESFLSSDERTNGHRESNSRS